MGSTKAIALGQLQSVTRLGLGTDVASETTTNLFTVAGTVLLWGIFGRVVTQKQATIQTLRLGHMPTAGGGEAFLCAASGTTSADDVGTLYSITGNIANGMSISAARGVSNVMVDGAGLVGAPVGLVLTPGILRMTTAAASDTDGDIDWTALYFRMAAVGGGLPASTDGMTVL